MESFARAVEIVLKESEPRDASGFGPTAVKRSDLYVGVARRSRRSLSRKRDPNQGVVPLLLAESQRATEAASA